MSFDYDSEEWQEEREEALRDFDGHCEKCGAVTDSPHVHHRFGTNKRIYDIWCPDCHANHHGKEELRNMRKQDIKCNKCSEYCVWKNDGYGQRLWHIDSESFSCWKPPETDRDGNIKLNNWGMR